MVLYRVPDRGVQLGLRDPGHAGEQPVGDLAASGRSEAGDLLAGGVELLEADEQEPGEVLSRARAPEGAGRRELLGEEGISFRALDNGLHLCLPELSGTEAADQLAHVLVGERREVQAVHRGESRPVREGGAQRVPPVQVVAAVRRDERDRRAEAPGEEQGQQVA